MTRRPSVLRRRAGRLVAVVGLVAAVGAMPRPAASQEAVSITQVSWWSQRPGATPQPEGGFEVAAGLGGQEQSVAGLRLETGGELGTAVLSLDEAAAVGTQTAGLRACTTTQAWTDANPGDHADRPPADCDTAVELSRDDAGGFWSGDIASLLDPGGTTLIVLEPVPGEVVEGLLPVVPGFQIQFSGAQVLATRGPPEPVGDGATATPSPSFDPPADSGFDAPAFDAPAFTDPGVGPADLALPDAVGPEAPAPATQTVGDERPSPTDDLFAAGPISGLPGDPKPWWRLVLLVPISAAVGVGAALGRRWWDERGEASVDDLAAPAPT